MNKANPINLEDQSASRGVLSPITGKNNCYLIAMLVTPRVKQDFTVL
ncbi:hypothetical protein [Psychrobacter sp. UBA6739]|nr:hypothetical protein [Psychrobacter sp. UBA6739]